MINPKDQTYYLIDTHSTLVISFPILYINDFVAIVVKIFYRRNNN